MFTWLTKAKDWIVAKWHKFEDWMASIAPGIKTKTVAALGTVGSLAGSMQEYVTGVPLTQVVTAEHAMMITAGLFTLAFWFKRLADRYN